MMWLALSLPMCKRQDAICAHLQTDVESVVAIAEDALELGGGSLSWAVEAVANEAWVDQVGWGGAWDMGHGAWGGSSVSTACCAVCGFPCRYCCQCRCRHCCRGFSAEMASWVEQVCGAGAWGPGQQVGYAHC